MTSPHDIARNSWRYKLSYTSLLSSGLVRRQSTQSRPFWTMWLTCVPKFPARYRSLPSVASSHKFLSLAPFFPVASGSWPICKTNTMYVFKFTAWIWKHQNSGLDARCSMLIRDHGVKRYEFILFESYEFKHVGMNAYCLKRMNSNMLVWNFKTYEFKNLVWFH